MKRRLETQSSLQSTLMAVMMSLMGCSLIVDLSKPGFDGDDQSASNKEVDVSRDSEAGDTARDIVGESSGVPIGDVTGDITGDGPGDVAGSTAGVEIQPLNPIFERLLRL